MCPAMATRWAPEGSRPSTGSPARSVTSAATRLPDASWPDRRSTMPPCKRSALGCDMVMYVA